MAVAYYRDARGCHVVEQPGKQPLQFLGSAGHQQMDMLALRDRAAIDRLVRQLITFIEGDAVEMVGEHPGRA
ncbi:hypothetical protein MBOE_55920 [Mycolicibacterium boenickei]|uniref:Alpha/beta hydrolase n=1 Tax=Mycolicibacterium boenickei TaxID=146017 RepID=A0ABM7J403_9MYCO|nr:hypothetical protein MBOE_55920 [Mycolicibacterium boenickei]